MKIRGLLVALALLAVLAGGIWYSNRRDKGKDTAAKADATDGDEAAVEDAARFEERQALDRSRAQA